MIYPDAISLELELLDRLKADKLLTDWRVEVSQLPGFNRDAWEKLFRRFPAVGTYCAKADYSRHDGMTERETAPLVMICAGQNLRNEAAPRMGDHDQPGAVHLVGRCREIVRRWPLPDSNLQYLIPKNWQLVWCNSQIAVCALVVEAVLTQPIAPTPEEIEAYGSSLE